MRRGAGPKVDHCSACKAEITPAQAPAVKRTGGGPMHGPCWEKMQRAIAARIQIAVENGTHTHAPAQHLCMGCREFRVIYCKSAQDGREYCFACAMQQGEFDKLTPEQMSRFARENPIPDRDPHFSERCKAELVRRAERAAAQQQRAEADAQRRRAAEYAAAPAVLAPVTPRPAPQVRRPAPARPAPAVADDVFAGITL